ncbi:MAG: Set3 complex subunit with deacetylase activity, meiotic-specific repressor of sporulation proteins, partial [Pleopsidium flavum]
AAELNTNDAKSPREITKWLPLFTVTYNQLDPTGEGDVGNDRWIPSFQAAPILAIKDLELSQYTAWSKRAFTNREKMCIWRVTRRMLAEAEKPTPLNSTVKGLVALDAETQTKFFAMEHVFWIKLSDFMDIVPRYPHLAGLHLRTQPAYLDPPPPDPPKPNGVHLIQSGFTNVNGGLPNGVLTPNGIHH